MVMEEYKCEYKLKDSIDIKTIKQFGYVYTGNYNRGDQWTKKIDNEVLRKITIHGDWDNRKIYFGFPYMKIKYPSIKKFILDLIKENMVEELENGK